MRCKLTLVFFTAVVLCVGSPAFAQLWSGILDPSRAIHWSQTGVTGGIPNRTTICATLNSGATAAQINTAISNCPAGQVVSLQAGTYNLTTGLIFNGKNNVTLRGAGPDATFLVFTGNNSCTGKAAMICVIGSNPHYPPDGKGTVVNWTSGYARGSTTLVLSDKTNLQIGTTIALDQLNDNGDADPANDIYNCTQQGGPGVGCVASGGGATPGRDYPGQLVKVTSIQSGTCAPNCSIGITPGLYMPNWRSAKSPQAWWSSGLYVTGVGIENLALQYTTIPPALFNIAFFNAQNSWVKNVRSSRPYLSNCSGQGTGCSGKHVLGFMSHHITVRDSYFFGATKSAQDSYGIDWYIASDNLVENNIFQRHEVGMMAETNAQGNVFAYNFNINNLFDSNGVATSWMQAAAHDHGEGSNFNLFEGNDGNGSVREAYFGLGFFFTDFRNRWSGWEPSGVMSNQSVPVHNYARARFHNYIGNVLGTNAYHTVYETYALTGSTFTPSGSDCVHSVYAIGLGGNCNNGSSGQFPPNDTNTRPSLMRWGNCDTVNGTNNCRFVSSEVPNGIAKYANAVPPTQSLPASLYLSAKPSWWGTMPWPAIGPDVTGGDVTGSGQNVNAGLNGRVYRIPARRCFEDVMGGIFGDTVPRTFNAANCYGSTFGTAPMAPTNVLIK